MCAIFLLLKKHGDLLFLCNENIHSTVREHEMGQHDQLQWRGSLDFTQDKGEGTRIKSQSVGLFGSSSTLMTHTRLKETVSLMGSAIYGTKM